MTLLTVFFSQWHQCDPCHIVWYTCGCCNTRQHTGNVESLQTISMEQDDNHTFIGWAKYVIILLQLAGYFSHSVIRSHEIWVFIHIYLINANWSLSDLCWLWLLLMRSCHWYVSTSIFMLWLTNTLGFESMSHVNICCTEPPTTRTLALPWICSWTYSE